MAKKKSHGKAALGAGVAVVATAAAVGAYFLAGERGKKNRAKLEKNLRKLKRDVQTQVKKIKGINKEAYQDLLKEIQKSYKKVKEVDTRELNRVVGELKNHWEKIGKTGTKKKTARKR